MMCSAAVKDFACEVNSLRESGGAIAPVDGEPASAMSLKNRTSFRR